MNFLLKITVDKKHIIPKVFRVKELRNEFIKNLLSKENIFVSDDILPLEKDSFDISFVSDDKNIRIQSIIEEAKTIEVEIIDSVLDSSECI